MPTTETRALRNTHLLIAAQWRALLVPQAWPPTPRSDRHMQVRHADHQKVLEAFVSVAAAAEGERSRELAAVAVGLSCTLPGLLAARAKHDLMTPLVYGRSLLQWLQALLSWE